MATSEPGAARKTREDVACIPHRSRVIVAPSSETQRASLREIPGLAEACKAIYSTAAGLRQV